MPGYKQVEKLVARELTVQNKLAMRGEAQVLNIPLVLGPVGSGKTAMMRSAALQHELPLLAINSGENSDATDVSGVPVPSMIGTLMRDGTATEREEARGLYMKWVLNRYAATSCEEPVLLFFDDLDKAPPPVQAAMLGICGNRMFRDQAIHPGTLIAGAGNRLGDDAHANEIAESLRTRMTVIDFEPDVASFVEYGARSGEIHEIVTGFLSYKPEYLHKHADGVPRFPTPRGWWEVSRHFEAFPNPIEDVLDTGRNDNWMHIVSLKCGPDIGNDFWAWYTILSKVDVEETLRHGVINLPTGADESKRRMYLFATIIATTLHLRQKGLNKQHVGITALVQSLEPELRVAFAAHLSPKVRAFMADHFKEAAALMIAPITSAGSP